MDERERAQRIKDGTMPVITTYVSPCIADIHLGWKPRTLSGMEDSYPMRHRLIRTIVPCEGQMCPETSNRECHMCEYHCRFGKKSGIGDNHV